jgi:putative glutathione S-transferase
MLVNGKWTENWQQVQAKDEDGRFIRQQSSFRHWVTPGGEAGPTGRAGFKAEKGRYHLYVAYICPWASRALMARTLKKLEQVISVSVVNPRLTDQGWQFGGYAGATEDAVTGAEFMHELYTLADAEVNGRATVPVLWDKQSATIVNNESADILRMLNSAFDHLIDDERAGLTHGTHCSRIEHAQKKIVDLYPQALAADIDTLNARIYTNLNNGVYQAGFASSQQTYDEAFNNVFAMLDELEARLSDGREFLFGDTLTETDVRTFVTLVRFDVAYHGLFKCNRNTLKSMTNLHRYMQRIWQIDGVADTVNIDHIKAGYYSITSLNPTGIVPSGPALASLL